MKRAALLLCVLILLAALAGCTGAEKTGIVGHFGEKQAESALYYTRGSEGMESFPLEAERLGELVDSLNSLAYRTHLGHTDYYWGGRFGIEIKFTDGTYWCYDGTKLKLRSVSMTENDSSEYDLRSDFAEVIDGSFWTLMGSYFENIEPLDMPKGW